MPGIPARFASCAGMPAPVTAGGREHASAFGRASFEQNFRISVRGKSNAADQSLIRMLLAFMTRGRMAADVDLVNADDTAFQCNRS